MEPIIKQMTSIYKWSNDYAQTVAFEYNRFLMLRNENINLSPSNDIDKFWHQHILNTKHYDTYCRQNFLRFIHHDPTDSYDKIARSLRLKNTISEYIKKFGPTNNYQVWQESSNTGPTHIPIKSIAPLSTKINSLEKTMPQPMGAYNDTIWYPVKQNDDYLLIKPDYTNLQKITFKIMYTFDTFNKAGQFLDKAWRKNSMPYDSKIISYHYKNHETIEDLKKRISEKTGHNRWAIKMFIIDNKKKDSVDDQIKLSDFYIKSKNLLVVLEEMSSYGYC